MDRPRGLDELRERRLPREVSAGASVEHLDQAPIVFSRAQHQHLAFRHTGLDGGRRPGTVRHREVDVEDRHVWERTLCLGDGLQAVTRLGHHVDLGLALEDRPHRLTEQCMPVGQEDPDAIRRLRQKTPSLNVGVPSTRTLPTACIPGTHRKPYRSYAVRMRAVMPLAEPPCGVGPDRDGCR